MFVSIRERISLAEGVTIDAEGNVYGADFLTDVRKFVLARGSTGRPPRGEMGTAPRSITKDTKDTREDHTGSILRVLGVESTGPYNLADSQDWYTLEGKRGQQLLDQGQVGQATEVFEAILTRLGDTPSYGRAVILGRLGRCFHMGGRPDLAVRRVREAIDVIGRLAPSDGVKGLRGTLRSELGDALRAGGQYGDAKKAYEAALKIAEELKDLRGQGVDLGQLGALALTEGKLEEALTHQQAALRLFQQLHEPEMEAAAWHQLGRVYHEQRQWDEAERHYREAARISEERGHLAAAAQTWNQLAVLAQEAGKPEEAEEWYRKALEVDRLIGNPTQLGHRLTASPICCRTSRVASPTQDNWPRRQSPSHRASTLRRADSLEELRHPRGHHRQRGANDRGRRTEGRARNAGTRLSRAAAARADHCRHPRPASASRRATAWP